jgi:hypothetical protein
MAFAWRFLPADEKLSARAQRFDVPSRRLSRPRRVLLSKHVTGAVAPSKIYCPAPFAPVEVHPQADTVKTWP